MRCLGIPNTKHFHDIVLIQVLAQLALCVDWGPKIIHWALNPPTEHTYLVLLYTEYILFAMQLFFWKV